MFRRVLSLLAGAVLATSSAVAVPAAFAADTGPVSLPLSSFGRVLLDEAHGHLFLSGGRDGDSVLVTDLTGRPVTTIGSLPGATGLALTPDGGSLWIAAARAGTLTRIDTGSLAVVQTVALGAGVCPGDVAVNGSTLVYGYSCNTYAGTGGYGGIGLVDLASGDVEGHDTSGPFYQPVVATGPAGQVYAADAGVSPGNLWLYDVTGTAPALVAERAQACGGNLRDLAPTPDGAQVVTACGSPYEHDVFSAAKLASAGVYPSDAYPDAAAWSGDGRYVAVGSDASYDTDVFLYPAGSMTPVRTVDFGTGTSGRLMPRGLATSRDGSHVYAVTGDSYGGNLALRVLDSTPAHTSTRLLCPADGATGTPLTCQGSVVLDTGAGVSGVLVHVTKTVAGASTSLPDATSDGAGRFTITDTPSTPGSTTYTATFSGDLAHAGSSGSATTMVAWGSTLTAAANPSGGYTGDPITFSGALTFADGASPAGVTLAVSNGDPESQVTVQTDASGQYAVTVPLRASSYQVSYAGDATHAPATATVEVQVYSTVPHLYVELDQATQGDHHINGAVLVTADDPSITMAGRTVHLTRTTSAGTVTLPDAVVNSHELAPFADDVPVPGTATYTATIDPMAPLEGATASAAVQVTPVPSTLTASAPDSSLAGDPVPVSGTLAFADGTDPAGAAVRVSRDCGTTSAGTQLGTVVAGAGGAITFTDDTAPVGSCTYLLFYDGTGLYASSSAKTAPVTISKRITQLSISAVRGSSGADKKFVYVTAHLGPTHSGRTVTISATPRGGATVVLATGTVDAQGYLTVRYETRTTTTYQADFAGDDWYLPATARTAL